MTSKPAVGARVVVTGKHPHSGKSGRVERYEEAALLEKEGAIVKFDDGLSAFVFDLNQLRVIDGHFSNGD